MNNLQFPQPKYPGLHPDWNQLFKRNRMKLWQAIALSLNINPKTDATKKYQSCGKFHKDEYDSRRINARYDLDTETSLTTILHLNNNVAAGDGAYNQVVDMRSFVQWANYNSLAMPQEMNQIWGRGMPKDADIKGADIASKTKATYLNIIGALLELMLDKQYEKPRSDATRSGFKNQTEIVVYIDEKLPRKIGLTKRTLEDVFAQMNKIFNEAA
jgi:hypothetical protein